MSFEKLFIYMMSAIFCSLNILMISIINTGHCLTIKTGFPGMVIFVIKIRGSGNSTSLYWDSSLTFFMLSSILCQDPDRCLKRTPKISDSWIKEQTFSLDDLNMQIRSAMNGLVSLEHILSEISTWVGNYIYSFLLCNVIIHPFPTFIIF